MVFGLFNLILKMVEDSVNLGKIEHATIYSDWHLPPSQILGIAGTILQSRTWSERRYPNLPIEDIFTPSDNAGNIVIGAGDILHTYPLFPFQGEIVPDALSYFAEALYKRRINGDSFRLMLGNHAKLETFPPDVLSFLNEENILVPNGKISFESGGENFVVIHGHEAQAGFYHLPFEGNIKVQNILGDAFDKFRKLYKNGYPNGQSPSPSWLISMFNTPQKKWQKRNLPPGTKMISGHTHFPEVTPDYMNTGFLDIIFGHLSFGKVDNGEMQSKFIEV